MITNRTFSSRFIAALMLVALLTIVLFSFGTTMHASGTGMQGDCLFSAMGAPLCPQDLAAAALHHISAYQSLLNTPTSPGFTALILALLLLASGALVFFIRPPAFQPRLIRYLDYSPGFSVRDRKTTRWLSLFEHSPSAI